MPLFGKKEQKQLRVAPRVRFEPKTWDEFIGHEREKNILLQTMWAAYNRKEQLRPILLYGPPGTGKTTLARLMVGTWHSIELNSATVEPANIVGAALTLDSNGGGTLILDEIHALERKSQESLYTILSDSIVMWQGETTPVNISIIACTTNPGKLASPLRARFSLQVRVDTYNLEELSIIAKRAADFFGLSYDESGLALVAEASRGTPRWVIRIIERIRDTDTHINESVVMRAISDLGFRDGFSDEEIKYMMVLSNLGCRAGLSTMAAMLDVDSDEVRNIESFLISAGMIVLLPRGRTLTTAGIKYVLGLNNDN